MRDPSIHITKTQFRKLLQDFGIKRFPTDKFFLAAKQKAATARIVAVTNQRNIKKFNNIALAAPGDANLAASILYAVRIQLKHRGVKKIDESDKRQWPQIKQLAEACNIFCQDFGLETREGYIQYIKIGFNRMGRTLRNFLPRLVSMSQNISDDYKAQKDLLQDDNIEATAEVHDYYASVIAERTGLKVDYKDQPEVYIYFKALRDFCEKNNISYENWIDAQFDALEWCNSMPEPSRLLGDKPYQYYVKFMYKHKSPVSTSTPKVKGSLWDQIRGDDE
ncbi:MAG: cysteine/serine-rich nuclear protein [Roseburia sp.]|nr:cysteine/serine-rich nuclear protein [Roseburia sp.]